MQLVINNLIPRKNAQYGQQERLFGKHNAILIIFPQLKHQILPDVGMIMI